MLHHVIQNFSLTCTRGLEEMTLGNLAQGFGSTKRRVFGVKCKVAFNKTASDMALRPASLAGLSRRVMASRAMAPTRSGGGGPIALGKPASQPVITHHCNESIPGV